LADRLLDRERHPAWHGRRMKLVYEWPTETGLWDQYAELRRRGQRDGVGTAAADEFYAEHRDRMDAGARVAWPARKQEDELSAIQHAWNLRIDRGESAFAAEFQNEPLADENRSEAVSPADIIQHAVPVPRWIVPRGCDTLTAFIDVQKELLYYAVLAWGSGFRSHVVAYGAYPEQGRPYFTLREAKKTLSLAHGKNVEAALHAGLTALMPQLLDREFTREDDDAVLRIGQVFIDANWAQSQGVVRDYARRSSYGPRVLPTHGRYVGASGQTISDKKPDKGERVGANWRTSTIGKQRHVLFDTNAWKTFMVARMKLPVGDPLGFTLHHGDHEMIAEQLASEVPVRVASKTRACDEWKLIPGRDNHLLDCIVGAAVAASFIGVSAVGAEARPAAPRKIITREEMAAKRAALLAKLGR
jgi:phage terminase large subunit GpA-like protein